MTQSESDDSIENGINRRSILKSVGAASVSIASVEGLNGVANGKPANRKPICPPGRCSGDGPSVVGSTEPLKKARDNEDFKTLKGYYRSRGFYFSRAVGSITYVEDQSWETALAIYTNESHRAVDKIAGWTTSPHISETVAGYERPDSVSGGDTLKKYEPDKSCGRRQCEVSKVVIPKGLSCSTNVTVECILGVSVTGYGAFKECSKCAGSSGWFVAACGGCALFSVATLYQIFDCACGDGE